MPSIVAPPKSKQLQPIYSAQDLLSTISIAKPDLPAEDAFVIPPWFHQQQSWIEDSFNSDSVSYTLPVTVRVIGPLNYRIVRRTVHEVQKRHQVLRSLFDIVDGKVVQIVLMAQPLGVRMVDLSTTPDAEGELPRLLLQELRRPFDLVCEPPFRTVLVRLSATDHVLLLKTHHIVCDDWSTGILIQELAALYETLSIGVPSQLSPLSFQYSDFIKWQAERFRGGHFAAGQAFWKERFADKNHFYHLGSERDRPAQCSHQGATEKARLSADFVKSLISISERNKITMFMTMLTAFECLLHCYSGETDIAVGTCAANRSIAAVDGLIGRFANDLVLRCDLSGNPALSELMSRVREVALNAYAHQDVPFGGILRELVPVNHPSRNPLFQAMFILQNAPKEDYRISDLTWSWFPMETGMAKYDLAVWLRLKEGLEIAFEYDQDILKATKVKQMLRDYQTVLAAMVNQSETKISELRSKLGSAELVYMTQAVHPSEKEALCTTEHNERTGISEPPDTIGSELLEIWRAVLGVTEIAASDDFFARGGDSVRATQLLIRMEEQFGVELSLDMMLIARTVEQQAELVRGRRASTTLTLPDASNKRPPVRTAVEPSRVNDNSHATPLKAQADHSTDEALRKPRLTRSILRRSLNRVLHLLCRVLPGATSVRPFLHRLRGVRIQGRVAIGDDVYIENEYPESVEIEDGAMIGLRSTIVAHTRGAGKIVIGKNVFIGANCVLLTSGNRSLRIGEGAVIMASSVITNDVMPHTLYGMDRAKPLAKVSKPFTQETSYEELIASLRPLAPVSRRG